MIIKLRKGSFAALVSGLCLEEADLMKPTQSWMESAVQVLEADILSTGCTIFWSTQSQSLLSSILSSLWFISLPALSFSNSSDESKIVKSLIGIIIG